MALDILQITVEYYLTIPQHGQEFFNEDLADIADEEQFEQINIRADENGFSRS